MPTADTLVELVRQQAARFGEKTAFSFSYYGDGRGGVAVSFRELDARARGIGARLQALGVSGSPVVVVCRPGLDGIAGVVGCWYAGAVAVPVPESVGPRLSSVIADVGAGVAVVPPQLPAGVRAALAGLQLVWCATGGEDAQGWVAPAIDTDSIAVIQYSAGSTVCPRGVVLTHENLLSNVHALAAAGWGDHRDVVVSWLPTHHERGLSGVVLAGIYLGCTTVVMAPSAVISRPMCWLEAVSRWRATVTMAPDYAYRLCVQRSTRDQREALDMSSLATAVISGAEPVRAATMRAFADAFAPAGFRGEAFTPVYGRVEATLLASGGSDSVGPQVCHADRGGLAAGWVAESPADDPGAVAVVGCGRPRQPVAIVDPDTRLECGPDEVGEIWVGGPGVARSYWGAPAQTDRIFEAFLADAGGGPFLRTGDRGFVRGGELFVVGRVPDLVMLGGLHYYSGELENAVADCHAVLLTGRGAAFADASDRLVIVHEVRCAIGEAELDILVQAIQSALSESQGVQADSILLVAPRRLPSTETGEIRRSACRWRYLDGDLEAVAHWQGRRRPMPADLPVMTGCR